MNKLLVLLFTLGIAVSSHAQFRLVIKGTNTTETAVIDSVAYKTIVPNGREAQLEADSIIQKLEKTGYLTASIAETSKPDDSTFAFKISLGEKIRRIHIYIGRNEALKQIRLAGTDSVTIPFSQTEMFLQQTLKELEQNGYALARLRLTNFSISNAQAYATLNVEPGARRELNDIIISGYDKFPAGHLANVRRMYRKRTFNQQTLNKLHKDFEAFRFVSQTKYPEILFSEDTTKVYVYLEKTKSNRFDGFIGFSNDTEQEKLVFTGYLDLQLVNIMNSGEELSIYWKSDGNEQKTFNGSINIPYIFKSPIGVKAGLNIFKQDSTFQNTRTTLDLGYFFSYNTRLYLGYEATESSDIQNQNSFSIADYKNSFATANFEYCDFRSGDFLFPEKTTLDIRAGIGKRKSNVQSNNQQFGALNAMHNFYLNEKNIFNVRSQNYYLSSDEYIINELYRFGGINSVRGFNENSLQANFLSSILTEYRFIPAPNLYVHSIIDYGYFHDKTSDNSGRLLGLGIGFGLLTKNGLLNLVYANGSTDEQPVKLSNSVVHISFKATF